MARRRPLRRRQAPAHLIEVQIKWPSTPRTHPPSPECGEPGHSTANRADPLAGYRRHRQRLTDALRPS